MRFSLAAVLAACLTVAPLFNAQSQSEWPVRDSGFTDLVQWDHYSLIVKGERLFIWSGEFHYWRIPVPEVWRDILEKIKAAGFNTVSIYGHWAYHAPSPDVLDFESGAHDFTPILEIAKELGLYVIWRVGPYVNAETTAGGFALWTTTGAYGALRNNDPRYTAAWKPYMEEYIKRIAPHQITAGGNLLLLQIENEISGQRTSSGAPNTPIIDYMEELQSTARDNGLKIPLFTNAPNMDSKSWSVDFDPRGAQDLYGLDSYPQCWSCDLSECGNVRPFTVVDYHDHFNNVSINQPSFIPEFQGGSYNPWGGPQGGCAANIGTDFVNVFYRHNIAERTTMVSLYMLYGGTNWGGLATNLVGTSYDYSAPIQETREIGDKYYETKLLGFFLRISPDLRQTDRIASSTNYTTSPAVLATELRNPATGAAFYVALHSDSADVNSTTFKLHIRTAHGRSLTIPQHSTGITLNGRESKIVTTDFVAGALHLAYSTAELLGHSVVEGKDILVLWTPAGEEAEFSLVGGSTTHETLTGTSPTWRHDGGDLVSSYMQGSERTVVIFDGEHKVVMLPRDQAYRFWAPSMSKDPISPANETLFVIGPYLVRTASVVGDTVFITGDVDEQTEIEAFVPRSVSRLQWNGSPLRSSKTRHGSLTAHIPRPRFSSDDLRRQLVFDEWKINDALPEREITYDDSGEAWMAANHTETPSPHPPDTLPVLYADEYGFHTGSLLWRARFNGTAKAVDLIVQGGRAFGWSAWLNGGYVGSFVGNSVSEVSNGTLPLPNALLSDEENVLVIVMDHSGHSQRAEALNPRGILRARLQGLDNATSIDFSSWRLAGNAGGEINTDPIRGSISEGGFHAERLGWHLPGFSDLDWPTRSPQLGIDGVGIAFFRTKVDVALPVGYDAAVELVFSSPSESLLRAQLYVNGYQYGKYIPQVGHQVAFPIPPGVLNLRGSNTIGVNLWSQSSQGARLDLSWNVLSVHESSWDAGFNATYLQPGWTEDRTKYA